MHSHIHGHQIMLAKEKSPCANPPCISRRFVCKIVNLLTDMLFYQRVQIASSENEVPVCPYLVEL